MPTTATVCPSDDTVAACDESSSTYLHVPCVFAITTLRVNVAHKQAGAVEGERMHCTG